MTDKEKWECVKDFKNPVLIINPDNKLAKSFPDIEVQYNKFMPMDRLIFMDKANMYQMNLDDFQPCQP